MYKNLLFNHGCWTYQEKGQIQTFRTASWARIQEFSENKTLDFLNRESHISKHDKRWVFVSTQICAAALIPRCGAFSRCGASSRCGAYLRCGTYSRCCAYSSCGLIRSAALMREFTVFYLNVFIFYLDIDVQRTSKGGCAFNL